MSQLEKEEGQMMSAAQLNELWHLDFKLAHELFGLPLRKCSAIPSQWGTPMKDNEFERLKININRMWLRASLFFSGFKSDYGWGIKVHEDVERKSLSLSSNTFTVVGWLAEAPPVGSCPTHHRYLRSPIAKHLYLGGPISLANWSNKPTVYCKRSISKQPSLQFTYYVQTVRTLPVGTEITWSYGIKKKREIPDMSQPHEWFLDDCCHEGFNEPLTSMEQKERGKTGKPNRKRARIVAAYRPCTYCGENLEATDFSSNNSNKDPPKRSMKPHMALNHTVEICIDAGLAVDDDFDPVTHKSFLGQLHIISRVIGKLESHNYSVKPACTFFGTMGRDPPVDEAEKLLSFADFVKESREAFRKYRVVYLRGASVPSSCDDLFTAARSDYKDVVWEGHKRPRSNTFSVENILSEEEREVLEREVRVTVEHIIQEYSRILIVVNE